VTAQATATARSRYLEWPLYLGAFVTYIPAAIAEKFLLNWICGPLWLIVWVEAGTRAQRRRRARRLADEAAEVV